MKCIFLGKIKLNSNPKQQEVEEQLPKYQNKIPKYQITKTPGVGGAVVNSDEEKLLDYGDQPPLLPPKREGLIFIFSSNQG